MEVETTVRFCDLRENKVREIGERFTVSKERYRQIKKYVREVAPVQPGQKEETAE